MPEPSPPTVLISSAGRRVELLRAFRLTIQSLGPSDPLTRGRVLAADCSWYSSAFHDADEAFVVPRCDESAFLPRMLEICAENEVDLVIPTIDPELPIYAAAREQFAAVNTTVAVSSPDVVAIAGDKVRTHEWLTEAGFPTVLQGTVDDIRADPQRWEFPLVVKPRFGSASIGVVVVNSPSDFDRVVADWPRLAGGRADAQRDLVVQQVAPGIEYTVDTLVGVGSARPAAVPRRRIEVRAGEVSKGVTVHLPLLIELAEKLCVALPGAAGPLNIQMFYDEHSGQVAIIEINARFGGGFPLSFAAGADFPSALVQEACGLPVTAAVDQWRDGLIMLRYDAAIFVDSSAGGGAS